MSVIFDKKTEALIIKYPCHFQSNEEYSGLFNNLLELLKNQHPESYSISENFWVITLMQSLIPNNEQAKKMFAELSETQQMLNELEAQSLKNEETISFLKESIKENEASELNKSTELTQLKNEDSKHRNDPEAAGEPTRAEIESSHAAMVAVSPK